MQIFQWGESLAVCLPATVVQALQLREGDQLEIASSDTTSFTACKLPGTEERLASLRAFRCRLPAGLRWSRDESNARD